MSTEIQKTIDNTLPVHLADISSEDAGAGLEDMVKHIRPPFVKIVEGLTKKEIKAQFAEGSIYCSDGTLLAQPDECFTFIPLLFFAEYWKCNKKGVDPFIIERTSNDASELAAKCEDPKYWKIEENGIELFYSKVLQFIILVEGRDIPMSISFLRGRMADGQNNLQKFALRKLGDGRTAPIFANVFECHSVARNKSNNDFHSFEFRNPSEASQWVQDPDLYSEVRQMHLDLKAAKDDATLEVQLDTDVADNRTEI